MIIKYNKSLIAVIFLSLVFSCRDGENPIPENGVYIVGWNYTTVKYWANGSDFSLGTGRGLSIALSGKDAYIAGYISQPNGPQATYWENRKPIYLTDGSKSSMANSIALSASDVYVVGYEGNSAMLWKNGIGTVLSTNDGVANGIVINGADIYVAGVERKSGGSSYVAKYWKNGIPVELSDGSHNANATSIAVVGNDIYVAGYESKIAKYWKNGVEFKLTDGVDEARAYAIYISGNDVYVAGDVTYGKTINATYWKNGTRVGLSDGTASEKATDIAVNGMDIYVVGIEYNFNGYASYAKYWKNGVPVDLTSRQYDSEANSIVLDF